MTGHGVSSGAYFVIPDEPPRLILRNAGGVTAARKCSRLIDNLFPKDVFMAIAYWCILITALLPYLWVVVAKQSGQRYNNRDPRGWLARQENPRTHRANAAQLNGFESFPAFVAGVLMAQLAGVPVATITVLAVAFTVARFLHGLFYVADQHLLRSLVWFAGFASALALIALAALRVG